MLIYQWSWCWHAYFVTVIEIWRCVRFMSMDLKMRYRLNEHYTWLDLENVSIFLKIAEYYARDILSETTFRQRFFRNWMFWRVNFSLDVDEWCFFDIMDYLCTCHHLRIVEREIKMQKSVSNFGICLLKLFWATIIFFRIFARLVFLENCY